MAARSTWKGYLKISLVNIPVKVFPATDAGATGKEIVEYVFEKAGVMIKYFASFRGRSGFFRISLGTHEENIICVQAIKKFFENRKKETRA